MRGIVTARYVVDGQPVALDEFAREFARRGHVRQVEAALAVIARRRRKRLDGKTAASTR